VEAKQRPEMALQDRPEIRHQFIFVQGFCDNEPIGGYDGSHVLLRIITKVCLHWVRLAQQMLPKFLCSPLFRMKNSRFSRLAPLSLLPEIILIASDKKIAVKIYIFGRAVKKSVTQERRSSRL